MKLGRHGWALLIATVFFYIVPTGCSRDAVAADQASDFKLKSLDGKTVSLSDFRGKVVLIDFWAVGCMPCRQEMPHFKTLHEKYKGRLVILAVNAWDESVQHVKTYAESEKLPFTILLDGSKVLESYKGDAIPMNVLVNTKGEIVFQHVGFDKEGLRQLDAKLKQLLG